ncbi:hypothetical protein E2320_016199 [Naja naja]|nr:hypothetical protein E2320_016199 [Naja naja]
MDSRSVSQQGDAASITEAMLSGRLRHHLPHEEWSTFTYHGKLQKAVPPDLEQSEERQLPAAVVELTQTAPSVQLGPYCWVVLLCWQLERVFGKWAWSERQVPKELLKKEEAVIPQTALAGAGAAVAAAAAGAFAENAAGEHAFRHTSTAPYGRPDDQPEAAASGTPTRRKSAKGHASVFSCHYLEPYSYPIN